MAARTKARPSDADAKRILNSIRQLVRALRLFDREAQTRHGISAAQMFVLHVLSEEEGLSLNEVADRTATDQSSASVVVQRLVDSGFVTRTAKKEDRRHVELRVTPAGRRITRKSPPPAQQRILESVAAMPARDRKAFVTHLESFVEAMGVRGPKSPMLFEDDKPKARPKARS